MILSYLGATLKSFRMALKQSVATLEYLRMTPSSLAAALESFRMILK